MKRILIGTIVASIIFFIWQSVMWMGGFNRDISMYTPNQEEILQGISSNLHREGMYMIPSVDPSLPDVMEQEEKLMTERVGKPWAMIFYHPIMKGMEPGYIIIGFLYTLMACLIAAMVIYYGNFLSFGSRFLVAISFGIFALSQGVLDDMNWWSYPWHFVKAEVMDLTVGWALSSLWLGWYVRR